MSYNEELADLRASIPASDMDEAHYERVRDVLRARTLTVVGSGGTLAVAELVALAHRTTTGRLAETSTPLQFAESTVNGEVALFLSARAKHPDTALAVRHALDAGIEIILITQRLAHELTGPLADPRIGATLMNEPRQERHLLGPILGRLGGHFRPFIPAEDRLGRRQQGRLTRVPAKLGVKLLVFSRHGFRLRRGA